MPLLLFQLLLIVILGGGPLRRGGSEQHESAGNELEMNEAEMGFDLELEIGNGVHRSRGEKAVDEPPKEYAYVNLCTSAHYVLNTLTLFHQLRAVGANRGEYVAMVTPEVESRPGRLIEGEKTSNCRFGALFRFFGIKTRVVDNEFYEPFLANGPREFVGAKQSQANRREKKTDAKKCWKGYSLGTGTVGFGRDNRIWPKLQPKVKTTRPTGEEPPNGVQVWTFTEYKKIIMLDSDILMLSSIDELFDVKTLIAGVAMIDSFEKIMFYEGNWPENRGSAKITDVSQFRPVAPPGSAPLADGDGGDDLFDLQPLKTRTIGFSGLNSGLLVLTPSEALYSSLVNAANRMKKRLCCPSQELVFRVFESRNAYERLDFKYHLRRLRLMPVRERRRRLIEGKMVHFVERVKPFHRNPRDLAIDAAAKRWWTHCLAVWRKLLSVEFVDDGIRVRDLLPDMHDNPFLLKSDRFADVL